MKIAFAAIVLIVLSFLVPSGIAQSTSAGHFQSVGGDYARSWLSANVPNPPNPQNTQANQNSQTDQNAQAPQNDSGQKQSSSGDLWSWGSAPKGSRIVGGELVNDPSYQWPGLNYTYNWLGDSNVNPYAERPMYSYKDPQTGETDYGYWDPTTGKMIPVSPEVWQPLFPGEQPNYNGGAYSGGAYPTGTYSGSTNGAGLPPVFNSNDPWA